MKLQHLLAGLALAVTGTQTSWAQIKVAVFSLNDFHGAFVRNDHKGIPGAPSIWQTLDSLKSVYPYHVTVSAGDNFGGSYFYNATQGVLMPAFFNGAGISISALGNHEFDDGQRRLAEKWENSPLRPDGWNLTYVCANVRNTQTGQIPEYAQPVASVPIELPNGKKMRVAFTGLIASSTPQQTSARKVAGLSFDGNYPAVLDSVMHLPEASLVNDATINLLLMHNGTRMDAQERPVWDDKNAEDLKMLESARWDGILSAHSHQLVKGRINTAQYPIVQGLWHGRYIGMLLCNVDTTRMVVTDVEPHTILVNPHDQLNDGPKHLQAQIDSLLQNTRTQGGMPLGKIVAESSHNMRHNRNDKYQQTEVGTLVCRAYAEAFRKAANISDNVAIIGCSHFGSIRAGLPQGPISVLDVGEALPFANQLRVYEMTGNQIMELVNFGRHNQRYGWLQTGNIEVVQNANTQVTALIYCSPKGRRHVLQPHNKYYVVADAFITTGGDGYKPELFPSQCEIAAPQLPGTTDAFINYLIELRKL